MSTLINKTKVKTVFIVVNYLMNTYVLYTNIDLKLRSKLHGPMRYKIGVTCVYNRHDIDNLL